MASLREYRDKDGKLISYFIRVHKGRGADGTQLKPYTTTFNVEPTWSEKTARKRAEAFAANFEKEIKEGRVSDNRQTFSEYCEYVISLKENRGIKHSTIVRYRELTARIYPEIGHMRLTNIRPDILNNLYTKLSADGLNKKTGGKLSNKTILEHHRLISTVLEQAVKEGAVPFNAAARADLPKATRKDVAYLQPEQVVAIRDAAEKEPLKWKVILHLFLVTGARRGEILGLKWEDVDAENNRLYICRNVLYSKERGIYIDTPKTAKSVRWVSVPAETIRLLMHYKAKQAEERLQVGEHYKDEGFVFAQWDGKPMHPDSVTRWLARFSERHDLPHINPHAFRHTMASLLYFNGVDSVSIAHRLGHAQVSTTANIYSHIIDAAEKRNADIIENVFLKKANF